MQGDLKLQTQQLGNDLTKAGALFLLAARWQRMRLCGFLVVVLFLTALGFVPIAQAQAQFPIVATRCTGPSTNTGLISDYKILPTPVAGEPLFLEWVLGGPFQVNAVDLLVTANSVTITPYIQVTTEIPGPPYCARIPLGQLAQGRYTFKVGYFIGGPSTYFRVPRNAADDLVYFVDVGPVREPQRVPSLGVGHLTLLLFSVLAICLLRLRLLKSVGDGQSASRRGGRDYGRCWWALPLLRFVSQAYRCWLRRIALLMPYANGRRGRLSCWWTRAIQM
jgi:hypothetical protein